MSDKRKVDVPDVMAHQLVNIINVVHDQGELVTGYVVLLETYNTKGIKKLRIVGAPGMPEYTTMGMIDFANRNFEYSAQPHDPDDDDDDFYDPNWHDGR